VAMERDKEIFKAILEPFIVAPVTEGFKKQQLDATSTVDDLEVEEYPDTVIIPLTNIVSKFCLLFNMVFSLVNYHLYLCLY
jgi:hypothetical protein